MNYKLIASIIVSALAVSGSIVASRYLDREDLKDTLQSIKDQVSDNPEVNQAAILKAYEIHANRKGILAGLTIELGSLVGMPGIDKAFLDKLKDLDAKGT